jgi:hypothetical protein
VVRKEEKTRKLSPEEKLDQDMSFMRHLLHMGNELTQHSIMNWWFPTEMQKRFERLFSNKPIEHDLSGILGVIMFAGIGFEDHENDFFENKVIKELFAPAKTILNVFFDSQQNIAGLLFGITVDDVSNKVFATMYFRLLTESVVVKGHSFYRESPRVLHEQKRLWKYCAKTKLPGAFSLVAEVSASCVD